MRLHHSLGAVLAVLAFVTSCRARPAAPSASPAATVLPDTSRFRSEAYHLKVELPAGWVGVEGPEELARPFTGAVAFNSWGEEGFWAHAVTRGATTTYSAQTVLEQIPADGVYVALVEVTGGPPRPSPGPEHDDASVEDLLSRIGCLQGGVHPSGHGSVVDFYKWARPFRLEVYCGPEASGSTLADLRQVLETWRFDAVLTMANVKALPTI